MFLRSEDQLLFLVVDNDGDLAVSEDAKFLFRVLSAEGLLRVVVDEAIVLELERLRNEAVEARLKANEDLDRGEYKRLKAKFEEQV